MSFEQGWISLHQTLSTPTDASVAHRTIVKARSSYPFVRDYINT